MMIFVNDCYKAGKVNKDMAVGFVKILSCFAPHVGEELYHHLTGEETSAYAQWPVYDESKLVLNTVTIIVQVNGKMRGKIEMPSGTPEEEIKNAALEIENVKQMLEGKQIRKMIVVPNKIVNIVAA